MIIAEKIRQIMESEELSVAGKLDSLHALISADVCKIDNLHQATPAQLRQLQDGSAITEAMQQLRRAELLAKETERNQISRMLLISVSFHLSDHLLGSSLCQKQKPTLL
jgi:hypothetical protein